MHQNPKSIHKTSPKDQQQKKHVDIFPKLLEDHEGWWKLAVLMVERPLLFHGSLDFCIMFAF